MTAPAETIQAQHLAICDGTIAGLRSNIDAHAAKIAELKRESDAWQAQLDEANRVRELLTA